MIFLYFFIICLCLSKGGFSNFHLSPLNLCDDTSWLDTIVAESRNYRRKREFSIIVTL